MPAVTFENLTGENIDALRELDNIGMGSAATALATMISTPTDISIPDVRIFTLAEASQLLSVLSGSTLGMIIDINGDISGKLIHILPSLFAERVINTFYEKKLTSWSELSEMDLSVIFEMTNIVSGQFCNALSEQLGMTVDISTPRRSLNLAADVVGNAQKLLFLNTRLIISENSQKEFAIFLPDENSLEPVLEKVRIRKK